MKIPLSRVCIKNTKFQVYIPYFEPGWEDLEQVYWTILSHYTNLTEPEMRTRALPERWCYIVGRGEFRISSKENLQRKFDFSLIFTTQCS